MEKIKQLINQFRFRYSPSIPAVDANNIDSRKNWILYMAQRSGKFPVSEVYEKMENQVSDVTINKDLKSLEEKNLIKRVKEQNKTYIYPLFEDSGIEKTTPIQKRREIWLNYGLPIVVFLLFVILISIHLA